MKSNDFRKMIKTVKKFSAASSKRKWHGATGRHPAEDLRMTEKQEEIRKKLWRFED